MVVILSAVQRVLLESEAVKSHMGCAVPVTSCSAAQRMAAFSFSSS